MAVLGRTVEGARQAAEAARPARRARALYVVLAAVAILALLRVVQTSDATTKGFSIQELQQTELELRAQVNELEAEVASLSSLDRIDRDARRIGLTEPADRWGVQVNVPPPETGDLGLPARSGSGNTEQAKESDDGTAWWEDVIDLLPFN